MMLLAASIDRKVLCQMMLQSTVICVICCSVGTIICIIVLACCENVRRSFPQNFIFLAIFVSTDLLDLCILILLYDSYGILFCSPYDIFISLSYHSVLDNYP